METWQVRQGDEASVPLGFVGHLPNVMNLRFHRVSNSPPSEGCPEGAGWLNAADIGLRPKTTLALRATPPEEGNLTLAMRQLPRLHNKKES
jgi:hypothetical protein